MHNLSEMEFMFLLRLKTANWAITFFFALIKLLVCIGLHGNTNTCGTNFINATKISNCSSLQDPVQVTLDNDDMICDYFSNKTSEMCIGLKIERVTGIFPHGKCGTTDLYEQLSRIVSLDLSNSGLVEWRKLHAKNIFPHLEKIDLSGNYNFSVRSIVGVPFLSQIKELILRGNKIVSSRVLENILKMMPKLRVLDVSYSHLKTFRFHKKIMLTQNSLELDISGNPMKTLKLNRGSRFLRKLNASNMQLTSIEWEGDRVFPVGFSLTKLDLSNNRLTKLPEFLIRSMNDIRYLNIKGNPIDNVSCSYYYLWKLQFKSDHEVTVIKTDFESRTISKPSLLSCSWEECPFECFCDPDMKTIDCSKRGLSMSPEIGPSEVEVLLLQGNKIGPNQIRSLLEIQSWCKLREINLNNNNLQQIVPESGTGIGGCSCQSDLARSDCLLPNLRKLSLVGNSIASFSTKDWKLLHKVKELDFSSNMLKEKSFSIAATEKSYTLIRSLNLSLNGLSNITMDFMKLFPFLVNLNISHNRLVEFDLSYISIMPQLHSLDLSYNHIGRLYPEELLQRTEGDPFTDFFPDLRRLYIHNNQLKHLNPSVWRSLQDLTLRDNNWDCNPKAIAKMQHFLWSNLKPNVSKAFENLRCKDGSSSIHGFTFQQVREINVVPEKKEKVLRFGKKFFVLIACTFLFLVFLIFLGTPVAKYGAYYTRKFCSSKIKEPFNEREFDVFIYYCDKDAAQVNEDIIPELRNFGCNIIHTEDFIFGSTRLDEFTNAVVSSRRMIAIISTNFFEDSGCIYGLRKGIEEEKYESRFKVACFYLEQDVSTPDNISPVIKRFLECKRIRRHMSTDMWSRNLRRFIFGSSQNPTKTCSSSLSSFNIQGGNVGAIGSYANPGYQDTTNSPPNGDGINFEMKTRTSATSHL